MSTTENIRTAYHVTVIIADQVYDRMTWYEPSKIEALRQAMVTIPGGRIEVEEVAERVETEQEAEDRERACS